MNIIVEGIDKSGKSTIVNDIRETLFPKIPITLKLSRKPQDGSFFEQDIVGIIYCEMFAEISTHNNASHVFLFDRSYPSEMVYSIKRGYDAMDRERLLELDYNLGKDRRTLLVYCEAPKDVVAKRFVTEGETNLVQDDIGTIIDRYEKFLSITNLPYIRINSTTDRASNILTVRDFLKI